VILGSSRRVCDQEVENGRRQAVPFRQQHAEERLRIEADEVLAIVERGFDHRGHAFVGRFDPSLIEIRRYGVHNRHHEAERDDGGSDPAPVAEHFRGERRTRRREHDQSREKEGPVLVEGPKGCESNRDPGNEEHDPDCAHVSVFRT
jgi:hypothetical protein